MCHFCVYTFHPSIILPCCVSFPVRTIFSPFQHKSIFKLHIRGGEWHSTFCTSIHLLHIHNLSPFLALIIFCLWAASRLNLSTVLLFSPSAPSSCLSSSSAPVPLPPLSYAFSSRSESHSTVLLPASPQSVIYVFIDSESFSSLFPATLPFLPLIFPPPAVGRLSWSWSICYPSTKRIWWTIWGHAWKRTNVTNWKLA